MEETIVHRLRLDQPAVYAITVPGRMEDSWSEDFDMTVTVAIDSGGHAVTTLTGRIADQAALHGLLDHLYDLGLPLLAVRCLSKDEAGIF